MERLYQKGLTTTHWVKPSPSTSPRTASCAPNNYSMNCSDERRPNRRHFTAKLRQLRTSVLSNTATSAGETAAATV
jgi:hypothetical protein